MTKILDVINFELTRTVRKRAFWLATLVPVIAIFAVYSISYISNRNAAKTAQQKSESAFQNAKIGILDESGLISSKDLLKLSLIKESSKDNGIEAVKSGQLDAFIYYPSNITQNGVTVYSQYKGLSLSPPYDSAATQLLKEEALVVASASIKNKQVLNLLQSTPSVSDVTYKNGQETPGLSAAIWPGLIALLFLTLVVLMSYIALTTTTEEKENRAAEILLTTIHARTLVLGKIITIFILGILQILAIAVPVVIAYLILKNHITLPYNLSLSQIPVDIKEITLGVLFAIGGFALFIGVLVGFGCLFPNATEANRFLGISILWAFIPVYTLAYVINSPDALIVKVFEYFPLTSPTTSLIKNAVGAMSVSEAILPLLIIYTSAVLGILFGIRAFRYSAMEYGRRVSLKEILKRN